MLIDYLKFKAEEFKDLLFIVIVLALLFSLTYLRFSLDEVSFVYAYFMFFLFLLVLFVTRLLFMKFVAYKNGFELNLVMTHFDRYYFNNYDTLSYTTESAQKFVGVKRVLDFKGFAMPIVSLILYILTLGFIIFPSVWRYKIKKIPHKFLGVKQFYEDQIYFDITNYRYAKVLFAGFLYYFIFGFFLKAAANLFDFNFYNWFTYALFWIAFFTMVPILGTEGWELFDRGTFQWINALTILVLGMLALLVFNSLTYILIITVIAFVLVFMVILWKRLM